MSPRPVLLAAAVSVALCGTASAQESEAATIRTDRANATYTIGSGARIAERLPAPTDTSDVELQPRVVGWTGDRVPVAPEGFTVTKYADGLDYPRWLHQLENGDVLVSEARTAPQEDQTEVLDRSRAYGPSANRITLLRDTDGDGTPDVREVFATDLNQPFGMLQQGEWLYIAVTDGLWRYPYTAGQTRLEGEGEKILDLPAGGYNNHWTRNVVANADGSKLYVTVGSASNVGEYGMDEEARRAAILEINPDGSGERIFASGLRNPNGVDWEPTTGAMWTAVNERDEIGDDLVPDYITRVQDGGFYGWPYAYYGQNVDTRIQPPRPDLAEKTLVPDFAVGSHTSAMSLNFYQGEQFPALYRGGAFVALHGSWNRRSFAGYKVLYVPFENGTPTGEAQTFLSGFITNDAGPDVYGRPTHIYGLRDGSLLLTDDAGDTVWRVAYTGG
ncbi:PQQ-dependent sugar dehydrogenase [Luteimonas deserti]|uniref:Sorbosone dehydrogenase family protein n=1 Tax=Luteimonas deserti TaxID=2752306 RepID=A0A7Z0QU42_9GAMM|nr:sorbosone dehydrogenase family protein [Luteimonas deserti]NYZ63872.1 sorbosone dehydrogenase family protein [Luteimonas deserti]